MTAERHNQPSPSELGRAYGFTEWEELFDRVSDERFKAILAEEGTIIHEVAEDYNAHGEFLFVTVSRPAGERRIPVVFYGQGYHEQRERWLTDVWAWYRANPLPERLEKSIPGGEAEELIQQRRSEIAPQVSHQPRSARARLYELLADLTDEDGALAELEDLDDAADWLLGVDPAP